ncbi:PfkB family carbohydrate kinase [Janibacter cremeus]|uniref:Fructokinase n=1 Tax=Janibacter cremeus TaxID=1285192 RepID=A0A852VSB4_9MICO|nr:PfkB family carbohydrate kinase [Janibacter cremeus]NYF97583.1 fructokinase [Janibacter cremeus]
MPGRRGATGPTLVIGEALIDVFRGPDGASAEHVGGSPLNVAVGLARLDHAVSLATHIGRDRHGAAIGARLSDTGVTLVPDSDRAEDTPVATATLDEHGQAEYEFEVTWRVPELPERTGHLHAGSYGALMRPGGLDVLAAMGGGRQFGTVSYDPNIRASLVPDHDRALDEVERRVLVSDVVKASDADLEWLAGRPLDEDDLAEWLRAWRDLGPPLVVCTRGESGAVAVLPSGRLVSLPGTDVEVADTVGAGDAFMSGLLSGLLDAGLLGGPGARSRLRKARSSTLVPAIQRGIDASAVTVTRVGAQPPTRVELGIGPAR